jgi:SWI/SNF-related matrix-associated actin-dependent regulator of chromatin subfamily A-like protein 1
MPLNLFPYQEFGGTWCAGRERGGLLDPPGLGKSGQIVRAIELRRSQRGLIIAPAHLRENWRLEFQKFSHFEHKLCRGRDIHDFVAWSRGVFDIMLLSYERAVKWAPLFHEHAEILDFIDLDEAHYCSSLETQRAKAIIGPEGDGVGGLVQWAVQSRWVTGTLMTNDPANCYTFLRFCRAIDMTLPAFVRKFFYSRPTTYGARNTPRPEMLETLQQLIGNNSIRRTFTEVGIELPPIFLTTTLVDGDAEQIRNFLVGTPGLDKKIMDAVNEGGLSFLDSQHIATLRRLIAEAKAPPYAEMLADELAADPTRKVVVMGISRDALIFVRDALAKRKIWCVLVQGGVSDAIREQAVRDFQNDPRCRVFIGNMRAAGTGLTLTAAAHIDILESDWTPAGNDQAIKRVRRLGQLNKQHARFITLARSLDEDVNRVVAEKTAAIAMVEGDAMIAGPNEPVLREPKRNWRGEVADYGEEELIKA